MFTVWYIFTPVACDSRYTLSTVRKLTPIAAAVLSRGLSIIIIISSAFFSILKNVLTLQIASFMSFDTFPNQGLACSLSLWYEATASMLNLD